MEYAIIDMTAGSLIATIDDKEHANRLCKELNEVQGTEYEGRFKVVEANDE